MALLQRYIPEPGWAACSGDADIAALPVLPGFELDLRALVTSEASVSLRGDDLVIGPAFGPILTFVNFVAAALHGGLTLILPDSAVITADRLLARLSIQPSIALGALTA